MQVNSSTTHKLNISRSPTDIQFNVIQNNYTYATILGKVTSGGTTLYSWKAMMPNPTGGLSDAPELGGGSISPIADPVVTLNEAFPVAVGSVVIIRRRCSHATFGSVWEVMFTKPKDQSSSGLTPAEGEPQLCYWSGTMYQAPQYVGAGPNFAPSGTYYIDSSQYARHRYWWLPKVTGPYGFYYLDTDPWNVSYQSGGVAGRINTSPGLTGSYLSMACIVWDSVPNITPTPFQIDVLRSGSPNYWYGYSNTPGGKEYMPSYKWTDYPSTVVTSNYKLVSVDYVTDYAAYKTNYELYKDVVTISFGILPSIAHDPMRLSIAKDIKDTFVPYNGFTISLRSKLNFPHQVYPSVSDLSYPRDVPLHDPFYARWVVTQWGAPLSTQGVF